MQGDITEQNRKNATKQTCRINFSSNLDSIRCCYVLISWSYGQNNAVWLQTRTNNFTRKAKNERNYSLYFNVNFIYNVLDKERASGNIFELEHWQIRVSVSGRTSSYIYSWTHVPTDSFFFSRFYHNICYFCFRN